MTHRFKVGDIIYWVCPISMNIDKIKVTYCDYYEENKNKPYYIDHEGAYLNEADLKETLEEAKDLAYQHLVKFHFEKKLLIDRANPKLDGIK